MARPKKQIEPVKNEAMSEQEAWDFVKFTQGLLGTYPNVYTPMLTNARMKDISLVTTGGITEAKVTSALDNPKESEEQLLEISEALEYSSMSYKRILQYMANLAAWDLSYSCKNVKNISEYKSEKYQKDLNTVKEFFSKFDYRKEFSMAIKQMLREEAFFCILRDEDKDKYTLQQLPSNYSMITGRWPYGMLFTFNYTFFWQGGVDIDMFPRVMAETYGRLFESAKKNGYNPAAPVGDRGKSNWAMYGDCDPEDNFWCFKLTPEVATKIPFFSGLFPDFAIQNAVRALQKNNYLASQAKILMGQIGTLKDPKASVRDQFNISDVLLGKFLQVLKGAINNDAVSVAGAPLESIQPIQFESDNDIYSSYLKTATSISGVNSNLIFSTENRQNQTETMLSSNVDEAIITAVYPYFSNFLEYHINKRTKYYKFKFNFEGTTFYTNRKERLENQMTLVSQGIVNPQKIACALGQDIFEFQAQLDEARAMGWVDNLTPIIPGAQLSGNSDGKTGRPSKSDEELSESGMETRDRGSNLEKGGKL